MCLMYGVVVVLTRSKAREGVVKLYGAAEQIVDDYASGHALTAYQVTS
jgi:hypothetical protein